MVFLFLLGYLFGAGSVVFGCLFWLYLSNEQKFKAKLPQITKPSLPPFLEEKLKQTEGYDKEETCVSLNLILQFFFQERQYDLGIHRWLTDLLNREFRELLKHKTLSRIIHKMEIQNLNLGTNFPVFKTATAALVKFAKDSTLLDTVEISVDVEYTGGFELVVDAVSIISKKAVVKIKVMKIAGKARLQLCRHPFTHWGFSFYEEPEVDFHVESSVLGHHIPKFKSLITNQLKNVIRAKHVLPYYKLRTSLLVGARHSVSSNADITPGKMLLTVHSFSRLQTCLVGSSLWCSVSVSELPLVAAYEYFGSLVIVQDIKITKEKGATIGFLIKTQGPDHIVDWIVVDSPAYEAGIRKGDLILAIGNTPLTSNIQAARLLAEKQEFFQGETQSTLSIRVKRPVFELPKKNQQSSRSQSLTLNSSKPFDEAIRSSPLGVAVRESPPPMDVDPMNGAAVGCSDVVKSCERMCSNGELATSRVEMFDCPLVDVGVSVSNGKQDVPSGSPRKTTALVAELLSAFAYSKPSDAGGSQSLPSSPKMRRFVRKRLTAARDGKFAF